MNFVSKFQVYFAVTEPYRTEEGKLEVMRAFARQAQAQTKNFKIIATPDNESFALLADKPVKLEIFDEIQELKVEFDELASEEATPRLRLVK